MKLKIKIPDDLSFGSLDLRFDEAGGLMVKWEPVEIICAHNRLPIAMFRDGPEDNLAGLIMQWYGEHRAQGGEPDPVAEEMLAEVLAERASGIATDATARRDQ